MKELRRETYRTDFASCQMMFSGKVVDGFTVGSYQSDPVCMAIELKSGDMTDVITVNLGNEIGNGTIMPINCAFIDVNNYPTLPQFIKENNLGEPYTRFGAPVTAQSGWVEYPLYRFSENAIRNMDLGGYRHYVMGYRKAFLRAFPGTSFAA